MRTIIEREPILQTARWSIMDRLPNPAEMTDQAILREYECVECDAVDDDARTLALVEEMCRRNLDF